MLPCCAMLRCSVLRCPMQVPIIAPVKQRKVEVEERQELATRYSNDFLGSMLA